MTRLYISAFPLLLALALMPFVSHAELFKWVDESGKIFYSDKDPGDKINAKVIPKTANNPSAFEQSTVSALKPIIRPYEKTARKLHLLDTRYLWKSQAQISQTNKLGVYHTGKGCTTRGAINTPDVFIHHKSLFPDESKLTYKINKIINGLDYESERTEKYRLLDRLQKTGGLSLHAEIISLDINTCAPAISKRERLRSIEKIAAHRFTKNRIKLEVSWQLKANRDQDTIYQAITAGSYNGWNQSVSSANAIGNALESAVLTLFSDRGFINNILVEEDGAAPSEFQVTNLKPISSDLKKRTRNLFLAVDANHWMDQHQNQASIGFLRFGDKCAAKTPLPFNLALSRHQWLNTSAKKSSSTIVKKTRPLGYSISPATADTLSKLENSTGYSLHAKLFKLTYDGCAPSLSASSKYKPVEKISFRKLSRNRLQVWIEWTLKSNRDRKLLYRTNTMGFAGSLLSNTRGNEIMAEAIGMAAEQLFADADFIDLLSIADRSLPMAAAFAGNANSALRGIVNSDERPVENLIIVSASNPWSRLSAKNTIGYYAFGTACDPYKERKWPAALNDYPRNFPDSKQITQAQTKVAKGLGYAARLADEYSVVTLKRKLGGYSLQADITELRYDSCAPGLNQDTVFSNKKISARQFKRHRVLVKINWKLIGAKEGQARFEQQTEGIADSWQINAKATRVFTRAIENATTQLFANERFIASLTTDAKSEPGFFDKLFSFMQADDEADADSSPSFTDKFLIQAHTAQVLSEINLLKIGTLEHYMMNDEWPDSLAAIGYSDSQFNQSETISYVNLQPDGSIVVELKALFGKDKIITLQPEQNDGNPSMNRWQCSSNLAPAYLPKNCESLQ